MNKINTSFTLSQEALTLLGKLAELFDRSKASTLEQLIKAEAKKQNIKVK